MNAIQLLFICVSVGILALTVPNCTNSIEENKRKSERQCFELTKKDDCFEVLKYRQK